MNTNYKTGLSFKEVNISRNKYGSNVLTKKKKHTFIKLVIESLGDPIIKILLIALCIKLLFLFRDSNLYETLGIAIAVFLASFISALSEYGSEKAFEKLSEENQKIRIKVLRESKKMTIDLSDIVTGDIVYLESGDKVPADAYIISGNIDVDESSLTGETKEKHKDINNKEIFMGSIVTNGNAKCCVKTVGDNTYYGNIASLVQEKTIDSPLKLRLRKLATTISKLGYVSALIILFSYLFNVIVAQNNFDINRIIHFKGFFSHLIYGLTLSVAVVVMAVPEGLPMMITLVLSSNMKRMLKKNVLVRKLVGIETAGSLNILFTDKTGTLTEGKLKVNNIIDTNFNVYNSNLNIKNNDIIYQCLVYNNDSFYSDGVVSGGNSTDKSILSFFGSDNRSKYKILESCSFDSKNKYSYVKTDYDNGCYFIKGAYEIIISKCSYYMDDGKKKILINKEVYNKKIKSYTMEGYRVIAFAYGNKLDSLVLCGFVLIKDNIRKSAYKGIDTIKKAGVQIVMVTGDAYDTAYNVSSKLGIVCSDSDLVLSSEEFNKMSDEEVKNKLSRIKVLCRSLPQDKNRLVRIAQECDLITGMTGDGVNDAPALKRSDVGFSMGSGTEVAREVSDIVILDNDIMSICTAILYGRTIFKSIRKFIIFQLSVNVCAVLLSVVGPFIGILSPITVIQVLWINMVMDTFAGLAFAFEPALNEYMEEKPKKRNEPILNKYMINEVICSGLYSFLICIWFLKSNIIKEIYVIGDDYRYLYTAFFGLFIFLAIFNAFNARTNRINVLSNLFKNKVFLFIIFMISVIEVILLYYGGELFRTTGLTIYEFEIMILISLSIIPFDMIRKIIIKKVGISRNV